MARPVKRFRTTRSVVAPCAASPEMPRAARLARKTIKAIPGRAAVSERGPFLSCRCAVIVDADKHPRRGPQGPTQSHACWHLVKGGGQNVDPRGSFVIFASRLAAA